MLQIAESAQRKLESHALARAMTPPVSQSSIRNSDKKSHDPKAPKEKERQIRKLRSSTSFVHHPQARRSHKAVSQVTTCAAIIQRRRSCDIESESGSLRQQCFSRDDYKSQAASRPHSDLPRTNSSARVARLWVSLVARIPRLRVAAAVAAIARVSRLWSISSVSCLSEGEAGVHGAEHVSSVAIARLWWLLWAGALWAGGKAGVARPCVG